MKKQSWIERQAFIKKELLRLEALKTSMPDDDWEAFNGFYYRHLLKKQAGL